MTEEINSLADSYQKYFKIGTCINEYALENQQELLKKHFNSFTCENAMKPEHLQPELDQFSFKKADKLLKKLHKIKNENFVFRGHTLVWHNQTPDWFFKNEKGNIINKDKLLARMQNHINKVMEKYQDEIYCWDVVNEAISDKNSEIFRKSEWYQITGKTYLEKAFSYARENNSEIKLFYNDYNAVLPEKRDKIYKFLKEMLKKDIPIDGMGIQGHWNIHSPSLENIKNAIEKYASLGLDIHITELDLSVYDSDDKRKDLKKPTREMKEKQKQRYIEIFELFKEYRENINNVTFWGTADDYTWKDNFPVKNRKDWPLLFDEKHNPKPAVKQIIKQAE
ncbi:MAG: endo-1,4-beta-xylanase [Halanaerobiales bacterium]